MSAQAATLRLLKPVTSSTQIRMFSALESSREKLSTLLDAEIKDEESASGVENMEGMAEMPAESTFSFVEETEMGDIVYKSELGTETITVKTSVNNLTDLNDGEEEEDTGAKNDVGVFAQIILEKPSTKHVLSVEATFWRVSGVEVTNVKMGVEEDGYHGPQVMELNDGMQESIITYLEARGLT